MFEHFKLKQSKYLKLLSVLFAILLWFFVISETNPIGTEYITIPITFLNTESVSAKGLGFADNEYNKEVRISVQGRRDVLSKITEKDFAATVDFASINEKGTKLLDIKLTDQPSEVEVKKISPAQLNIAFDTVEERTFPVSVILQGNPTANYQIISSFATSDSILINSLTDNINKISRVAVYIDVSGVDRDVTVRKACKIINLNGDEIAEMKDKYFADVKLEVAKQVRINPTLTGEKPAGVYGYSYDILPENVWVTGPGEVLSGLTQIDTEPVNLSAIGDSGVINTTLTLPAGVKLYQSEPTVQISFTLVKTGTANLKIPASQIKVIQDPNPTYTFTIMTQEIEIALTGIQNELNTLTVANIEPSVNITGLKEGMYNLQLTFKLPTGVEAKTSYFVEISIEKAIL